jgi:predicted acetyltransferase
MPTSRSPERVTRLLTADDFDQTLRLGLEAFGQPPAGTPLPTAEDFPRPGAHTWGTFEGDELVARLIGREYGSWFHAAAVPTCGIAGVTVVAERRGAGLMRDLFHAVLTQAAARGEVISTLFPTAPGIYRRLGYELVGSYDTVAVPTAALATVSPAAGTTTRRARTADVPALRGVYDAWAARQNGPLTRRGPSFPATDDEVLEGVTGITLAEEADGRLVGYAMWRRGSGYDISARIEVEDLVTLTSDAARALWRVLGSFASVTGSVRLRTSGSDVARLVLPFADWDVVERHPYMLRVHDVAAALSALPPAVDGQVDFRVEGDPLGTMDGDYRLRVAAGRTTCERAEIGGAAPVLTPQGMALLYAGDQSCGNLRLAGHLRGGGSADDAVLDAMLGSGQLHIRDYF